MTDYVLCTWRVRSTLLLPEVAPWLGPDAPVDIEFRPGVVPASIGERSSDLPYIESAPDGSLLLDATPFARFLVTFNSVVVDAAEASEPADWRVFLLGPVLGLLCYLRGLLPLHASAVRIGGVAIAVAGHVGAGKSTIAAALVKHGHSLITDDVCPIDMRQTMPLVLPTYPALKLSADTLEALCIDLHDLERIGPKPGKLQLRHGCGYDPAGIALEKLYLIEDAPEETEDKIMPIVGAEIFERLSAEIYRPGMGRLLLPKASLFAMTARLSDRLRVRRIVRWPDLLRLSNLAEKIEIDATKDSDGEAGLGPVYKMIDG